MLHKNAFTFLLVMLLFVACSKTNDNNTAVNNTDTDFMQQVSYLNYAFKDAAALAADQGDYDSIKVFANNLIATVNKIQSDMTAIAGNLGIALPTKADSAHQAEAAYLATLSGHKFDTKYIDAQVTDLQNVLLLYDNELSNGNNTQVINLARTYLSAMVNFSEDAIGIQAEIE